MSKPSGGRISVIIPTLNEAENVEAVTAGVLKNTAGFDVEIIIVDDGSSDGTQEKVNALAASRPVRLLARKDAKDGLAGAVLAGARLAISDVVVVMDADLSHPPERLPDLVQPVLDGSKDMVIGSRYAPGGSTPEWPWKRRMMSRAASALAWPLTDVHDSLSGFFALRRDLLTEIPADAAGFKIALEVLVRGGESLRVGEIPITFRDRTHGQSKMAPRVIFTYFRRLLALSGWRGSTEENTQVLVKNFASWLTDFIAFVVLIVAGANLSAAHLTSFALASIVTYFASRKQNALLEMSPGGFFGRFLLVRAMAAFLRGGVLALCNDAFGCTPPLAILPAIAASALVSYLGFALYIWPIREHYGRGIRWRVASLGIVTYLSILRLVYLNQIPLLKGEAAGARDAATGSLAGVGAMIFGESPFGIRIGAVVCSAIASGFCFQMARDAFDKTTAFRALMLAQILPFFFATGFFMTPETLLVACWAGVVFFVHRALFQRRAAAWLGAFGALALTVWFIAPARAGFVSADWQSAHFLSFALLSPLVLITPVGVAAVLTALFFETNRLRTGFLITLALLPFVVFVCAGRHLPIPWTGALWVAAIPSIAHELDAEKSCNRFAAIIHGLWPPTFLILILAYGALLHWRALGSPRL